MDIKFQSAHALSTLLDPRFKAVCYTVPIEKQWAKDYLCEAVEKTLPPEENSEQTQGTTAPPAAASSDVWDVFGALASTSTSSICSRRPSEEVEEYLYSPVRPRSENPYLWWRNLGKDKYPLLAKVAQLYLSIPATQVSSERLFSTSGNVVTSRRELLLPEHVEQLVFIHSNME